MYRNRRDFLKTAGSVILGSAALSCISVDKAMPDRPNIIIFFTDDQATLDTRRYGAVDLETPHMDALADDGVLFTRAYAHAVCCPARALLLTGRDNVRTGVNSWIQMDPGGSDGTLANMHQNELTIAKLLQDNGYRTGLIGKWHLGARAGHHPRDFGFDYFFGHLGGYINNYNHTHSRGIHDLYENDQEVFHNGEYYPTLITTKALEFIDHNQDNPFFLYMAVNVPHYPMQPDPTLDYSMYDTLTGVRQSYAKMISTADNQLGLIVDKVDSLGLTDNTLVIFMSDNGHEPGPRDEIRGYTGKWIGQKHTLLEGGIRVPLIISYPGKVPGGATREHMVGAEDIFPTILEAAGIPRPTDRIIDGRSLWPILQSSTAPPVHTTMHRQWQGKWAVIEEDWKLLNNKLYSLTGNDPERQDLASSNQQVVSRLEKIRDEWNSSITTDDIGKS